MPTSWSRYNRRPNMEPFGPLIGVGTRVVEKLYDRFEAAHGVRLELDPSLVGFSDGSRVPFILLTVRNRGVPQKVEDVALRLSNGRYLLMPGADPAFQPLPAVVTMTDAYQTGFRLDDVKAQIAKEQRSAGRVVSVIGARVRLASGRPVHLRKRSDVENEALFRLGSGPRSNDG